MTPAQQDVVATIAHLHLIHGRPRRALTLLRLIVKQRPDDIGVLRAFAHALVQAGRGEEAMAVIDRLQRIDRSPTAQTVLLLLRSRALHRSKRIEEARASFTAFVAARKQLERGSIREVAQ